MFRKMRRIGQQLSDEECIKILESEPRGVLAVNGEDGYPYALPIDYIYLDGKLYFHCAKSGHKLDAIRADGRVSFCVMDKGYVKEGEWALNIKSVIVFGRISIVEDETERKELVRKIGLKYYPTAEAVDNLIARAIDRIEILEMTVDHMTGKLVNES